MSRGLPWLALLVVLLLMGRVESCGLTCFLSQLHIEPGNLCSGKDCINELACDQVTIGGLDSSSAPAVFRLSLRNLTFTCSANWVLYALDLKLGDGTVAFQLDMSVSFGFAFSGSRFPTGVAAANISNAFVFSRFDVHAKNPVENWILERLEKFVRHKVEAKLDADNVGIVEGIASGLSSNLAALSASLSQPMLPTAVPLFADPQQYWTVNAENPLLQVLTFAFNEAMGVSGPLNLNFLLERFSGSANGTLQLGPLTGNKTVTLLESIGGIGSFDVSFFGATVSNLNTFNLVELFLPVSNNVIESRLGLEELSLSNISLAVAFQFNSSAVYDSAVLYEEITLSLDVANVSVSFSNLVLIDADLKLGGGQYFDPGCLERSIQNFTLSSFDAASSMKSFSLNSPFDTDPLDSQVGQLMNNMLRALDLQFPLFVPKLAAKAAQAPLMAAFGNFMQKFQGEGIANGSDFKSCGLYVERTDAFWANFPLPDLATILSFSGAALASALLIAAVAVHWYRHRQRLSQEQSCALLLTVRYNAVLRAALPVLLFLCLACFVVVMLGTTGFSSLLITVNQTQFSPPAMFLFNLPDLLTDAYDARAWANVIGLAVFGVFWMFARQVFLLALYVAPAFKWRTQMIFAVDILGKWCGFFFVEAMLIPIAFRVHVEPPVASGDIAIDLYTAGSAAYFLYMLGLFVSIIVGNFIYAMAAVGRAPKMETFGQPIAEALFRKSFMADRVRVKLKSGAIAAVSLLLLLSLGLTVAAILVNSFAFTMEGLAGKLLPLVGSEKTRSYSVMSVVLKYGTIVPVNGWTYVSQVSLFVTCVAFPIVCCCSFFFLFFVPMKLSTRRAALRCVIVLRSWNFLEVFLGALLAAMLSISLISQFLLGSNCTLINQLLGLYFADLLAGDPVCYDVQTTPLAGFWIMLAACIVSFVAGQLVVGIAEAALRGSPGGTAETSSDGEFLIDVPRKRRTSWWLDQMTEEVESRAFRTDLIQ